MLLYVRFRLVLLREVPLGALLRLDQPQGVDDRYDGSGWTRYGKPAAAKSVKGQKGFSKEERERKRQERAEAAARRPAKPPRDAAQAAPAGGPKWFKNMPHVPALALPLPSDRLVTFDSAGRKVMPPPPAPPPEEVPEAEEAAEACGGDAAPAGAAETADGSLEAGGGAASDDAQGTAGEDGAGSKPTSEAGGGADANTGAPAGGGGDVEMAGAGEPQAWREDTTAAGAPASALTTLVKAEPSEGGAGVVAEAGGSAECGAGAAAAEATPEESPAGAGDDAAAAPGEAAKEEDDAGPYMPMPDLGALGAPGGFRLPYPIVREMLQMEFGDEVCADDTSEFPTPYVPISRNRYVGELKDKYKVSLTKAEREEIEADRAVCQCLYVPGIPGTACGANSDCMLRQLYTECDDRCPCKSHCMNKRLQQRAWSRCSIFRSTNGRGWALRNDEELVAEQLVMEYIGEVPPPPLPPLQSGPVSSIPPY